MPWVSQMAAQLVRLMRSSQIGTALHIGIHVDGPGCLTLADDPAQALPTGLALNIVTRLGQSSSQAFRPLMLRSLLS